jgi:hypothetical protein
MKIIFGKSGACLYLGAAKSHVYSEGGLLCLIIVLKIYCIQNIDVFKVINRNLLRPISPSPTTGGNHILKLKKYPY